MGVFNEVYKKCPKCGGRGYDQIKSVGSHEVSIFDLDDPESLARQCTSAELQELYDRLTAETLYNGQFYYSFTCGGDPRAGSTYYRDFTPVGCGHEFRLKEDTAQGEVSREILAKELFGT